MTAKRPDARTRALAERRPGDPTPLGAAVNFGPVTLPGFAAVGVTTLDQIERLGADEVCRRYVERFPERLNGDSNHSWSHPSTWMSSPRQARRRLGG